MRISDFILLNEEEKQVAVLHEGVLIAKRKNQECMVFLFQLGSYYVETYFSQENKELKEFRIFENIRPLSPYLEAISLEDLFN